MQPNVWRFSWAQQRWLVTLGQSDRRQYDTTNRLGGAVGRQLQPLVRRRVAGL